MPMLHCSNELGTFDYDDSEFELKADDDGTSYLSYIGSKTNGKDIDIPQGLKNAKLMFSGSHITNAPIIPDGIENADSMFLNCPYLKTAGHLPESLKNTDSMYSYCTSLETAPYMPNNIRTANFMYDGCDKITIIPNISQKLQSADGMFANCTALKAIPDLPDTLQSADSICLNCRSLQKPPQISDNVKNIECGFAGCDNLQVTPVLPDTAEYDNVIDECYWATDDEFDELNDDNTLSSNTYDFKHVYQNAYNNNKPTVSKETLQKAVCELSFGDTLQIDNDLLTDIDT